MKKAIKILINLARLLLGAVFVFSGFVKAIDPLGTSYKIKDYFEAFDWTFFSDLSLMMAVLLAATEFFLGAALLLGIWKKTVSLLLLLFMSVVTPLTLYLAIKNPVTDCGCFGDALILTNWQTFFKNLVLLLLAIVVFFRNDKFYLFFGLRTSRYNTYWCIVFPLFLSLLSYRHLPVLDFRPYKIGNRLEDLMKIPAGAPTDSFEMQFIYEKNGVKKEFSADNAPLSDPSWTFVDRKERQIRKGYVPPIHDFVILHPSKGDITEEILKDTSYTFLLVSPKLEESNTDVPPLVDNACNYAKSHNYAFYGLTNSGKSEIEEWNYEYDSNIEFCSVDDRVLKTIIRSNPGLVLLKDGVVIQKWAFRDIPDFSKVKLPLNDLKWGKLKPANAFLIIEKYTFLFLIPILFFYLIHKGYRFHYKLRNKRKTKSEKA